MPSLFHYREYIHSSFFKLEIVVVNCNLPGMTKKVWFINFCYWPRYLYFSVKSVCRIQLIKSKFIFQVIVHCRNFFFFLHVQILIILFKDLSYLPNLSTILQQNGILKHTIPIALNNMKIN